MEEDTLSHWMAFTWHIIISTFSFSGDTVVESRVAFQKNILLIVEQNCAENLYKIAQCLQRPLRYNPTSTLETLCHPLVSLISGSLKIAYSLATEWQRNRTRKRKKKRWFLGTLGGQVGTFPLRMKQSPSDGCGFHWSLIV